MWSADAQFMAAVYQEARLLPTDPGTFLTYGHQATQRSGALCGVVACMLSDLLARVVAKRDRRPTSWSCSSHVQ